MYAAIGMIQGISILMIGSAICPADMHTCPSPEPPELAPKLRLARLSGKAGRFSRKFEIPRLFRQEMSSCLASLSFLGPTMGGEQSLGMQVKWGDGRDLRRCMYVLSCQQRFNEHKDLLSILERDSQCGHRNTPSPGTLWTSDQRGNTVKSA